MENSKLLVILRTLTKAELRELEKFISSSYFTTGRDCTELYGILKQSWPDFKGEKVQKKYVYESLYAGKTYGDKKSISVLSTISSELYRLVKEYLTYSGLKSDERGKKLLLLRNLPSRHIYHISPALFKKRRNPDRLLDGSPALDPITRGDTHRDRFILWPSLSHCLKNL